MLSLILIKKMNAGMSVSKFIFNNLLTKKQQRKIRSIFISQLATNFLDLVGVSLTGVLGSLLISGTSSNAPGTFVYKILGILHIQNLQFKYQAAFIAIITVFVLSLKSIFSLKLAKSTLKILGQVSFEVSDAYLNKLIQLPLQFIKSRSNFNTLYSLTTGVNAITLGMLAAQIQIWVDLFLLFLIIGVLFYTDIFIAFFTILLFGALTLFISKKVNLKSQTLSVEQTQLNLIATQKISELLQSYREIHVRGNKAFFSEYISNTRKKLTDVTAEISLFNFINKFYFEIVLLIATYFIAGLEFMIWSAQHAVAVLAVFLAASSRLVPTLMRLQQSLISLKTNEGLAEPTLKLIQDIEAAHSKINHTDNGLFWAGIVVENITVSYSEHEPIIENITFQIPRNSSLGIVGPSGAGKSTLVDAILGVLNPDEGQIYIDGIPTNKYILDNPGSVAYVPQQVHLISGTLRENILFGMNEAISNDFQINEILEKVHLTDFVMNLKNGLDTQIGEGSNELSGGQRQRIGLARALVLNPRILILDEATSALDSITETQILEMIDKIKNSCTLIVIAHRLSTVRNLDNLVYIENGKLISQGNFELLRKNIKNFDDQAKLLGL